MPTRKLHSRLPIGSTGIMILVAVALIALIAVVLRKRWLPATGQASSATSEESGHAGHDHGGHDHGHKHDGHDHAKHDETTSIEISAQARKNLGLETGAIKLQAYMRKISVPALVVGRPGRSHVQVTAPLGGRVTRIYPIKGETVESGQPLFDLLLTHAELVRVQSDFLRSIAELDVVRREITRLQSVTVAGAIPGKRLLERKYEEQKTQASIDAQRQSLLLHGLNDQQITSIVETRTLLKGLTVFAPSLPKNGDAEAGENQAGSFVVRELSVNAGQYVDAGIPLCLLTDFRRLYIQGRAFEQDAEELVHAATIGLPITATPENNFTQAQAIEGLKITYVENEVERDSRALRFYVDLENEVVLESRTSEGHRFTTWRYKPGQRMQLHVPVERWEDRIVLPVDAVAKEGVEYFVFQQNGDHFDRISVHVEHQDQFWVVVANDGAIYPGDTVAMTDAHQLQIALKNKSGGGVDPHAGHNH